MRTKRQHRLIEPADTVAMLRRMIRSAGVRCGNGDPEDIAALLELVGDLHDAVAVAITRQRETGITWESIGQALGTTRQAALMRWGRATPPDRA